MGVLGTVLLQGPGRRGGCSQAELCQARSSPDGSTVTGPLLHPAAQHGRRGPGQHELPHSETRDSSSLSEST